MMTMPAYGALHRGRRGGASHPNRAGAMLGVAVRGRTGRARFTAAAMINTAFADFGAGAATAPLQYRSTWRSLISMRVRQPHPYTSINTTNAVFGAGAATAPLQYRS